MFLRATGRRPLVRDTTAHRCGARGKGRYDEVVDDPVLGCVSPGMPRVMLRSGPYAVRFMSAARISSCKTMVEIDRIIHMDGREPAANQPYTPLGYSVGKWEGEALVITTTAYRLAVLRVYGLVGVPQSRAMRIVERFTPRDGGATLEYDWSATDPPLSPTVTYERLRHVSLGPCRCSSSVRLIEEERKAETPVEAASHLLAPQDPAQMAA